MKTTDDVEPQGPFCTLNKARNHRNPAYRYAVAINHLPLQPPVFYQIWKKYKTIQDAMNALRDLKWATDKRIIHLYYADDGRHGRTPLW